LIYRFVFLKPCLAFVFVSQTASINGVVECNAGSKAEIRLAVIHRCQIDLTLRIWFPLLAQLTHFTLQITQTTHFSLFSSLFIYFINFLLIVLLFNNGLHFSYSWLLTPHVYFFSILSVGVLFPWLVPILFLRNFFNFCCLFLHRFKLERQPSTPLRSGLRLVINLLD